MRLRIELSLPHTLRLPTEHYHILQGVVYGLLGQSNPDLATFLHDEGFASADTADTRRYKFFAFSNLRVPKSRRRVEGERMTIAPGAAEWLITSPKEDFLRGEIDALLRGGGVLMLHNQPVHVTGLAALPAPDFSRPLRGSCLTPIICAVPSPDGRATPLYLRPKDGAAFSDALRANLLGKHRVLHGRDPHDDRLTLTFDPAYIARNPHGGTKKATVGNIDVVGALAPFTLAGSPELMQTAWETGLGQRNAGGFGMWDVAQ